MSFARRVRDDPAVVSSPGRRKSSIAGAAPHPVHLARRAQSVPAAHSLNPGACPSFVRFAGAKEGKTEKPPFFLKSTGWKCPRHALACECSPSTDADPAEGEGHGGLEDMIRSIWKTDSEREAVARKLKDSGIRSMTMLRKCLFTPVWYAKVPPACYYREAPPLLNVVVRDHTLGGKQFRSATLHAMAAHCQRLGDECSQIFTALQRFFEHEASLDIGVGLESRGGGGERVNDKGSESRARETAAKLMAAGFVTLADLRGALLVWEESCVDQRRGKGGDAALPIGGERLAQLVGNLLCRGQSDGKGGGGCSHKMLYSGFASEHGFDANEGSSDLCTPRAGGVARRVPVAFDSGHGGVGGALARRDSCGVRRFLAFVDLDLEKEARHMSEGTPGVFVQDRDDARRLVARPSIPASPGSCGRREVPDSSAGASMTSACQGSSARLEEAYTQHSSFAKHPAASLPVITSAACDSEGEARKMMEKFVRIGVRGPWELTLALYSWLPEVHPQDKSIGANSTALNQLLADRLGRSAMLSSQTLLRLMALLTVESSDGASGLLFTAPHGVFVHRPGHADHKPEVYTTFLAVAFAELTGSSYAVWSASERCKSDIRSAPDTANIDPNYAAESNLSELPWNRILSRHVRRFRAAGGRSIKPKGFVGQLHFDIHGRRDAIAGKDGSLDESDCDIGVGAMLNMGNGPEDQEVARRLASALFSALSEALEDTEFMVNEHPTKFSGFISSENHTMTMQAVRHGLRAVQLELSLRLRKRLRYDEGLRSKFAHALLAAAASAASASASAL